MVKEFEAWFRENEQRFKDGLVQVEIMQRDAPSEAIKADLETESYLASLICWETGAFDVHVLSLSAGDPVFVERYDLESVTGLIALLEETGRKLLHNSFAPT